MRERSRNQAVHIPNISSAETRYSLHSAAPNAAADGGHSLTAPLAIPLTRYLDTQTVKMIIGTIINTA